MYKLNVIHIVYDKRREPREPIADQPSDRAIFFCSLAILAALFALELTMRAFGL